MREKIIGAPLSDSILSSDAVNNALDRRDDRLKGKEVRLSTLFLYIIYSLLFPPQLFQDAMMKYLCVDFVRR